MPDQSQIHATVVKTATATIVKAVISELTELNKSEKEKVSLLMHHYAKYYRAQEDDSDDFIPTIWKKDNIVQPAQFSRYISQLRRDSAHAKQVPWIKDITECSDAVEVYLNSRHKRFIGKGKSNDSINLFFCEVLDFIHHKLRTLPINHSSIEVIEKYYDYINDVYTDMALHRKRKWSWDKNSLDTTRVVREYLLKIKAKIKDNIVFADAREHTETLRGQIQSLSVGYSHLLYYFRDIDLTLNNLSSERYLNPEEKKYDKIKNTATGEMLSSVLNNTTVNPEISIDNPGIPEWVFKSTKDTPAPVNEEELLQTMINSTNAMTTLNDLADIIVALLRFCRNESCKTFIPLKV